MEAYVLEFYLYCDWKDVPPTYRLYFDDELMTERTYIWHNDEHVLQERVPVVADPTQPHTITIEQVGQHSGKFWTKQIISTPEALAVTVNIG